MIKRFFVLSAALCLILGTFASCRRPEPEGREEADVTEEVKYIYQLVQKEAEYLPEKSAQAWREPLLRLLQNVAYPVYDGDDLDGYEYPYPDRPGIMPWWELGLYDLDLDGTPELLVNRGGGSAGNSFFEVHDLMSGERLGSMHGGGNDSWCLYFNKELGRYETYGEFQWRGGWSERRRYINRAILTRTREGGEELVHETNYLYSSYSFDMVPLLPNEQGEIDSYDEICNEVHFAVNGSAVGFDEYYREYDHFREAFVRLHETGLRLVERDDEKTDDEIVDALLSTGQKFLKPN